MRRVALRAIGVLECLLGVAVLLWPGAWQELVHPRAMGTVFYPLQAMAAGWILRGALTALPRPGLARGAWCIDLPMSGVFLLRAGALGPWAALIHCGRLVLAGLALFLLAPKRG